MVLVPSPIKTSIRRPTFRRGSSTAAGKITKLAKQVMSTAKHKRAPYQQRMPSSPPPIPAPTTAPTNIPLEAQVMRVLGSPPPILLGQTIGGSSISIVGQQRQQLLPSAFDDMIKFFEDISDD